MPRFVSPGGVSLNGIELTEIETPHLQFIDTTDNARYKLWSERHQNISIFNKLNGLLIGCLRGPRRNRTSGVWRLEKANGDVINRGTLGDLVDQVRERPFILN